MQNLAASGQAFPKRIGQFEGVEMEAEMAEPISRFLHPVVQ
jgi:hypothetical protein